MNYDHDTVVSWQELWAS